MDKIKENGTFPSYSGYKIRYIPNYALKSSSKCSTHQAASDGTFKFMNIPTQTCTKNWQRCDDVDHSTHHRQRRAFHAAQSHQTTANNYLEDYNIAGHAWRRRDEQMCVLPERWCSQSKMMMSHDVKIRAAAMNANDNNIIEITLHRSTIA